MKAVEHAETAYEVAALNLIQALKTAYPVGSRVEVNLGGHDLILEVTGHCSSWWHRPEEMYGVNLRTGKQRSFTRRNVIT